MPYKIKKIGENKYQVSSPTGIKSKGTSKGKAEKQIRLLQMIKLGKGYSK